MGEKSGRGAGREQCNRAAAPEHLDAAATATATAGIGPGVRVHRDHRRRGSVAARRRRRRCRCWCQWCRYHRIAQTQWDQFSLLQRAGGYQLRIDGGESGMDEVQQWS
jgi:hypothetical protein